MEEVDRFLMMTKLTELAESRASLVLQCLDSYQDNYDGYGGLAPTKEVRELTQIILSEINIFYMTLPDPEVSPVRDGGIEMEWKTKSYFMEIELSPNRSEFRFKDCTGRTMVIGDVTKSKDTRKEFPSSLATGLDKSLSKMWMETH